MMQPLSTTDQAQQSPSKKLSAIRSKRWKMLFRQEKLLIVYSASMMLPEMDIAGA
jgi:hypothetical protein